MMKIYHGPKEHYGSIPNPVVTLGNFDGVHLGHRRIFQLLRQEAQSFQGSSLVITFFPHPLKVLCPERAPLLISSLKERLRLIQACGIDYVACIDFTKEFADWSPDRFVKDILVDRLAVKKVLIGEDFRFGKGRAGGFGFLTQSGRKYGFQVNKIEFVQFQDKEISSTFIRQAIQKGQIRRVRTMLDRPYSITGTVVHGDKRGRTLGFPTANIDTKAELIPPNGVYAVWVTVGGDKCPGAANLGIKPTFAGEQYSIEVNILDFDKDIYGETIQVDFIERIREERSFPNVDALVEQIQRDSVLTREILGKNMIKEYNPFYEEKIGVLP